MKFEVEIKGYIWMEDIEAKDWMEAERKAKRAFLKLVEKKNMRWEVGFDVFFACGVIYVKADLENVRFNDEMKSIEFMQPDGEGGVHYALDLYTLKQNIYGRFYKCI